MKDTFISKDIMYIGADDKDIDLFESQYIVPNGISYNSYLIKDEKTTIMDTVDKRATDEWLKNVEEDLKNEKPHYLVVSHLEPDHSANIEKLVEKYPEIKIILSQRAATMLPQFTNKDLSDKLIIVKEAEEINLGTHTLQFFMAPMVHWPEVMVTYEKTEKICCIGNSRKPGGLLLESKYSYFSVLTISSNGFSATPH